MAIWKEQTPARKDPGSVSVESSTRDDATAAATGGSYDIPRRSSAREIKESVIAANITIEGKIEGSGHIRLAGRFKGDVHVEGDLTIEPGAKLTGGVRARTVIIGGELEGNIEGASRVELQESGALIGNVTAESLTVAAGSRMRGQAEFGWDDKNRIPTAETRTAS